MSEECCGCKFFREHDESDSGLCKRYPPVIVGEMIRCGLSERRHEQESPLRDAWHIALEEEIPLASFWPTVGANDWCGEWKAKEPCD